MKKIFKYIFAGMAAMSVVACSEDALETSPSSSVSGEYMAADLATCSRGMEKLTTYGLSPVIAHPAAQRGRPCCLR